MEYPVLNTIKNKLDFFLHSKKIPHIIFHGPSGTGKRTIVNQFLSKIYGDDKAKMKSNIMFVNCAHGNGRGIKFIREDLKFFAKSNIQFNCGVIFKTIVLLNADSLTTDAQSALRRCIELFSFNTRFFLIVENKHKLLNPILSRFCEIYIPETMGPHDCLLNLHSSTIQNKYHLEEWSCERMRELSSILQNIENNVTHKYLVELSSKLYELGYSCLDVVEWFRNTSVVSEKDKSAIVLCFHKIKSEFRCEKLLMLYLFDYAFLRPNKALENIGFI
jgi:DNA polymerase III delta prime subunit